MTQPSQFILQEAWQQCERHLYHLKPALGSRAAPTLEALLEKIRPLVG